MTAVESSTNSLDANETSRLEAFSDGVFAIAVTLLVLELKVPDLPSAASGGPTLHWLGKMLAGQWPSYFAFVTSFFTVLVMWVHHHAVFRLVCRSDAALLFANGFLLMMITAVPFPTAIVARYLMTPAAKLACGVYAGTFVLIAIGFQITLAAAFRPSLLSSAAPPSVVTQLRTSYRTGPWLYLAAALAAFFSAWLSLAICTVLWVYWAAVTTSVSAPKAADVGEGG